MRGVCKNEIGSLVGRTRLYVEEKEVSPCMGHQFLHAIPPRADAAVHTYLHGYETRKDK